MTAIYTSCQDTCPRTLAKLRKLYDEYTRDGRRAEFVVVTLDPDNDTPDQLRKYKIEHRVPESWHLLRGDPQETEQLGGVLAIHPMATDGHFVHESRITVFDADGVSNSVLDVL